MKTALLAAVSTVAISLLMGCSAPADAGSDGTDETGDALSAATPLGATPAGRPTRYPLVLAHGFMGSANGFGGFHALIGDGLSADGHTVYRGSVAPFGMVHERALMLARDVDRALLETGAPKVNIVAHSMGGLDARELVSILGYGDRVASVTTISTPHRGSAVADVGLKLISGEHDEALDAFANAIGKTYSDVAEDAHVLAALADMAEANAPAFNEAHPDDPRVYYQSWAGVSSVLGIPNAKDLGACDGELLAHAGRSDRMNGILVPNAAFVAHGSLSNDGLVLVSSAKWGTFRGCVPADHADEIGFMRPGALDPHTGFDFVRFYRNVAFELAARGF
jgi:triacylglycerol lipase